MTHDRETAAPAPDAAAAGAPVYSTAWSTRSHVKRTTVDLTPFPGLVVMYLGMRLNSLRGLPTMVRFGRQIQHSVDSKPDGLLLHERIVWSPRQLGMRQYWRDFESLERFALSAPHRDWWRSYLQDTKGTGFWHETYFIGGGFEAIYDNMRAPIGLLKFAPHELPTGGMFSARRRLAKAAGGATALPVEPGSGDATDASE